jgi:hypothetical protein
MLRPFQSELVLEERISEATLRAYHVGYDQNKFRLQPLVDVIRRVIPEFSLGYIAGNQIPSAQAIEKLREAALIVYTTDKYQRRGEFGELILHLLLRDFCNTLPLIAKIYFKDSYNVTIHGFDGVHVTTEDGIKKLWLGESKLYTDGKSGIIDLSNDLKEHFAADYLRQEFDLISKKLPIDFPEIDHWRTLMDKHQKLDVIYSSIVIPMVCTYTSDTCRNHCEETEGYIASFLSECRYLESEFQSRNIRTDLDVILMLLPVYDKDELNTELDNRLKAMQNI